MLEDRIQNPSKFLFRFPFGGNVMHQRSGDGRVGGRSDVIALKLRFFSFPEFWDAGCEDCICSEQDHPEFLLQEKGQFGGTESSERRSVPSRKTDRLHDLRLLPSHWCPFFRAWLRWLVLNHSSQRRRSGIRYEMGWNLLSMTKIPPDDVLESLYKIRIRECDQLSTVLELYDMEIHQKISMPDYQKLKTMVEWNIHQKLWLRNFDAKNERIETGAVVTSRRGLGGVERWQGVSYQRNAKGQCSRGYKWSFRHDGDERAKPTPKTAPPSEPPTKRGRSAPKKKNLRGRSPSGKLDRQPCKNFLKGTCTKLPCDYWHPPECQFSKSESGCKFGDKCSFAHRQVYGQPSNKPKKDGDKSAAALLKDVRQLGGVFQDRAAGIFIDFTEEHKSLGTN